LEEKKNLKVKKRIFILSLIVFSFLLIFFLNREKVEVKVERISKGKVIKSIEEVAVVKAENQNKIYSRERGTVLKVFLEEGDFVKKGDYLVELETTYNQLSMKELEEQIAFFQSEYKVNREKNNLLVKRNFDIFKDRERTYLASKKLFEERLISKNEYQSERTKYLVAKNMYTESLGEEKKFSSSNLTNSYESRVRELKHQMNKLKKKESDANLYSPLSGKVLDVFVKEGEYIVEGKPLFEVGNDLVKHLEADLLAEDAMRLKEGNKVIINDSDLKLSLLGRVSKIFPLAFTKLSGLGIEQKRVKVEIEVARGLEKIIAGAEIDLRFVEKVSEDRLRVPKNSIFTINGKDYVFVVDEREKLEKRAVEIGLKGDNYYEVLKGIGEEEIVVISPDNNLEEGIAVNYEV